MRLAVYTDYAYHRVGGEVFAERAFALFLGRLARRARPPRPGRARGSAAAGARYAVGAGVELVSLPYYRRLSEPWTVLRSSIQSLARFWRALRGVDGVWLLGPHPLAIAFAALAAVRRRGSCSGCARTHAPTSSPGTRPALAPARGRRPRRGVARAWPAGSRWWWSAPRSPPTTRAPGQLLEITVSLVTERDLVPVEVALGRSYEGELRVISVGRLEAEKNPLLLADVLARLREDGDRWRLVVCGEGAMQAALEDRLRELGVAERAELCGYVPYGPKLLALYRDSHALLHVSWTEGFPQVLVEAFAAGLPVVATDVGGVAAAVGEAVRLVPAGDAAAAAASELQAIAADRALREAPDPRRSRLRRGADRDRRGEARGRLRARRLAAGSRVVPPPVPERRRS